MFSGFLDFLFPRSSLSGREGEWMTEAELRALQSKTIVTEQTALRAIGLKALDRVTSCGSYHDIPLLKKAVHTFKYKRIPSIGEKLSEIMSDAIGCLPKNQEFVLCPVPLHWTRQFWRGFNQAEILAEAVHQKTNWPIAHLLKRKRPTGHQAWRKRSERFTAVADVFELREKRNANAEMRRKFEFRPSKLSRISELFLRASSQNDKVSSCSESPKFVLLIDDLFTTGATLDSCAKTLKQGGVQRVEALVLAQA